MIYKRIFGAVFLFLGMSISVAFALPSNGSFETGIATGVFTTIGAGDNTSISDWTVDSGNIDYIGSYWASSDGVRSIDMNGGTGGAMSTTLPTVVGVPYRVTFDLSGNPECGNTDKILSVQATGGVSSLYHFDTAVGNDRVNMMWRPESYFFTATDVNTTISFASLTDGACGPALDNVRVSEELPLPPPPPTFLKVHILKYLDGQMATVDSVLGAYQFPMVAFWDTGSGPMSGNYVLGNSHGGATELYGADTSDMNAPSNYTTSEVTDQSSLVLPIGAPCESDKFRLLGYQESAISFDDALTHTLTNDAPVYSGITSDRFVIVQNETCPIVGTLNVHKITTGGDGVFNFVSDIADNLAFSITTLATEGVQTFSNILVGEYHITESLPLGWAQISSNCDTVTILDDETSDCTIVNAKLGTISGMKYNDRNRNGRKDVGEEGLRGWTIRLLLDDHTNGIDVDTLVATAVTDTNGNYSFTNLAPATYEVREVQQKGWKRTTKNPKDIVIIYGSNVVSVDFGNAKKHKEEKEDNGKDDHRKANDGEKDDNHHVTVPPLVG